MPVTYIKTPIGFLEITEEDGCITKVYARDGEFEINPPETAVLAEAVKQLNEYFNGERKVFDLPLNQHGSSFQEDVWDELSKIGYGKTISYLEQSARMNNPLGIRAIASANGKNHLLIIVPCHRVIGSDGSLTGFGAGLWRKKWLLEHEAKVMGGGQMKLEF